MITYAQLQKVGFVDDDEEASEENSENAGSLDHVESAKQKMYSQIGSSLENMKFVHYVHNDLESTRARRNFSIRRRQPFQLYKCDVCGSEFVHRTHLKIHQRTHTGEKPYKCNCCGRCFAQKGNLHVHMKIHTGEKDFICEYCQRGFITNAQLFVHMRTHTNPNRKRPYATGRPPKIEQVETKETSGEETTNQIIVQLVQPEGGQPNLADTQPRCKSPVIPPTESRQLENISETAEPGEANLKPISPPRIPPPVNEDSIFNIHPVQQPHQVSQQQQKHQQQQQQEEQARQVSQQVRQLPQPDLHNLIVPDPNLRGLAENGTEMIHILVAQQ